MAKKQDKVLMIILAIILPPLAVYLKKGVKKDFWINILLTICFIIPGIIHALIIVT
ncbi:YqaE/Pmp3 family membrane protein [bacterium]